MEVQVNATTKSYFFIRILQKYVQHFCPQNAMFVGRFGDIFPRREGAGFYIEKEDQKNIQNTNSVKIGIPIHKLAASIGFLPQASTS